jgi:hypothetical protein
MHKFNIYKTKELRKEQSIEKLKKYRIDYINNLPLTYEANEVRMKSVEMIAKRYIANIISIQVACDILNNADIDYSIKFFTDLLERYNVKLDLNELEKKVFNKKADESALINLSWQYESINVLAWILGLKKDLEFPKEICDVNFLMERIATCKDFDEFIGRCNPTNIEDALDELDLEYRYHWAIVEKRINPSTNIGDLNGEIVVERRRALEWLFSDEEDWNEISLDT